MLRWLYIFTLGLLLLCYLSPYISPTTLWLISFIGVFYPILLVLNILLFFYWIWKSDKKVFIPLIAIALGWNFLTAWMGLHFKKSKNLTSSLKVMTYNLAGLSQIRSGKSLEVEQLSTFLNHQNCDILCFQEFTMGENAVRQLVSKLQLDDYPYRHFQKEKAVIILSKKPFTNSGIVAFDPSGNGCVFADIEVNDKSVRLYCSHLSSSSISTNTSRIASDAEDGALESKKTLREVKGILSKYSTSSKLRAQESLRIAEHIQSAKLPIILCADMNETPTSFVYRNLTEKLFDGFKEVGKGIATTYNGLLPTLRIDYILASKEIGFVSYTTPKVKFSDHYPVVAELSVK